MRKPVDADIVDLHDAMLTRERDILNNLLVSSTCMGIDIWM